MTTITKKTVSEKDGIYTITLNLVYTELDKEIINQDFSQIYNPKNDVNSALGEIKKRMQEVIDKHATEKTFIDNLDISKISLTK